MKKATQFLAAYLVLTLVCTMVTHFLNDLILEIWEMLGTVPQIVDQWLAYVIMICVVFAILFSDFALFISLNGRSFRYQHWRRRKE